MPNGRLGDHPLTDLLNHGHHPFPPDIEEMILKLRTIKPSLLNRLNDSELCDWESGKNLDAGREKLRRILNEYEVKRD